MSDAAVIAASGRRGTLREQPNLSRREEPAIASFGSVYDGWRELIKGVELCDKSLLTICRTRRLLRHSARAATNSGPGLCRWVLRFLCCIQRKVGLETTGAFDICLQYNSGG